jgi:signal peptidase I
MNTDHQIPTFDVLPSGPALAAAVSTPAVPARARRTGRAGRWAGSLLLALALGLAALMLVPTVFGYQRYVITGGSMTGSIDRGSVVFDQVVPVKRLRVGDVITYTPPASAPVTHKVTHRVVWIGRGRDGFPAFRTRGDANAKADPWTFELRRPTQARVAFHVPYVGYALSALSIRWVRMLAIGVPALLIALSLLVGMWRDAGEQAGREEVTS